MEPVIGYADAHPQSMGVSMPGVSLPRATRRISLRKKVVFASVVLIGALGLCEAAARVWEIWSPPLAVDYGLGFDSDSRVFQTHPFNPALRQTTPDKLNNFLNQQFLTKKPAGTLRIVALGGSSVYQLQEELEQLGDHLRNRFSDRFQAVDIINAGGRAYGSHREVLILRELLEYDPDLVLIYTGHNEFEEVEQLEFADLPWANVHRGLAHSAVVRFLRDRVTHVRIRQLQADHNRRVLASDNRPFGANYLRAWQHRWTPKEVDSRMSRFHENLAIMVDLCRARNLPLILGTVPSNLVRPAIAEDASPEIREKYQAALDSYTQGHFAEGKTLVRQILRDMLGRHQSSDLENEIIRSIARESDVPLADVEKAITEQEPHGVPGMTYFMDHCHLNADGRKIWRETYEPVVISEIEQRTSTARSLSP